MKNKRMKEKVFYLSPFFISLAFNIFIMIPSAKSSEQLSLVHGIFNRTISIDLIEHLANTGEAKGSLKNLLRLILNLHRHILN